jgi:hypothetical protein
VVIWARDGECAYYDSKLQPKASGLGMRDVLREAVEKGHKHGLPVQVAMQRIKVGQPRTAALL